MVGDSTLFYWRSSKKNPVLMDRRSGERGIRTLDRVAPIQHFQCCAFDHSASSPPAFTWGKCECSRAFQSDRMGTSHRITIHWRQEQRTITHDVPEGEYILQSFERQGDPLPFSCRNGCCTSCAVRVKQGQLDQREAMGLSHELRQQGYGLLCVARAIGPLEAETQDEDEVYDLQFGRHFGRGKVTAGLPLDEE